MERLLDFGEPQVEGRAPSMQIGSHITSVRHSAFELSNVLALSTLVFNAAQGFCFFAGTVNLRAVILICFLGPEFRMPYSLITSRRSDGQRCSVSRPLKTYEHRLEYGARNSRSLQAHLRRNRNNSINRAHSRLSGPDSPLRCSVKKLLYFFVQDDAFVRLGPCHIKKTAAFRGCTDHLAVCIGVVYPCNRCSFFLQIRGSIFRKGDDDGIEQDGRPSRELKL